MQSRIQPRFHPVLCLITDPVFFCAAIVAVTMQGLAKGGFSGLGIMAVPILSLVVSPIQGAAILLPTLLMQDAVSVWVYRRNWHAWNLKVLLCGAVFGIAAAGFLAAYVSDSQVRLVVGLIALSFVLWTWFGFMPKEPRPPTALGGIIAGAAAGFTSTFAHAGAPPFQIHILPQRLDKLVLVGTATMFFAATNLLKVIPYFALGQFTTENLATSLVLMPVAILTNLLGVWLVRRTPQELFYRIAYILVFLVSLELIRNGIAGLLR